MSNLYNLQSKDFINGAITAVFAAIFLALSGLISQNGFDLFSADWSEIGKIALNAGVAGFVGYIGRKFFTDQNGKLLGKI